MDGQRAAQTAPWAEMSNRFAQGTHVRTHAEREGRRAADNGGNKGRGRADEGSNAKGLGEHFSEEKYTTIHKADIGEAQCIVFENLKFAVFDSCRKSRDACEEGRQGQAGGG